MSETDRGTNFRRMPANQPMRLKNTTCVYCGAKLTNETRDKEHVIARRFVPLGYLDETWNLIVWACREHNAFKARIEDEISAVTMQPDLIGKFTPEDPHVAAEAIRKGTGSVSSVTGKPVSQSRIKHEVEIPFGDGIKMTASFLGPPQLDPRRVFQLAEMHMMAFFYLVTYNREANEGFFWIGDYAPLLYAPRSDWGNITIVSFTNLISDWRPLLWLDTARGHFKAAIRRSPRAEVWGWALEWNANYRVIGFFGRSDAIQDACGQLERGEPARFVQTISGPRYGFRAERPLPEEQDTLFREDSFPAE